jgi:hypothetical protein
MDSRPAIGMTARGRYAATVFAILLLAYGYVFPRWADWNQNSRFDLTRALVEHRTVAIDRYAANTGDYATVRGHIVSDKAPGLSLLAVPPYGLYRLAMRVPPMQRLADRVAHRGAFAGTLNPNGTGLSEDKADVALALMFVTFACVAIPAASLGVLLARLFRRFSPHEGANAVVAVVLMLATPVAAYGNAFYGHVPVGILLFAAFALLLEAGAVLSRVRLVALGALFGAALVMEYPGALIVAALGIWTLVILWRSGTLLRFGWLALGGAPPLALLALYDRAAYGTLFPTGYEHSTLWQDRHSEGFVSLTYPKPDALWGITFGDFRGLFFLAPVLLLAVPGLVVWWRAGRDRAAWFVAIWSIAAFFLFDAASAMWWGGFAVGPRYLLPMLPFCCYPIGALIPALVHRGRLAVGGATLAGVSLLHVWGQSLAGQGYPPDTLRHPLTQYVWARLRAGDIARNAGMAAGLHGLWSILPLGAVLFALVIWGLARTDAWKQRSAFRREVEARYVRS